MDTTNRTSVISQTGSKNNTINNNNESTNDSCNCISDTGGNINHSNMSMIKALGITRVMIRITVCVSIVFTSNIMVIIVLVSLNVLSLHQNASMMTILHLCYSIDLMVNNICLLYQYQFAQNSYDKNCKLCNKFLKNIIFCSIETNMKTIVTQTNHVSTK